MKFQNIVVYKERHFAIYQEVESGKYCIAIPVRNSLVDYMEYYEMTPEEYHAISGNVDRLEALANKCRRRENDERLMMKPGSDRGWAV